MILLLLVIALLGFLLTIESVRRIHLQGKAAAYKAGVERAVLLAAGYANERDVLQARLTRQAETSLQLADANAKLRRMLEDAHPTSKPAPGQIDLPLPNLPVREDFDPYEAEAHATMLFLGGAPKPGEVKYVDGPVDEAE